MAWERRIENYYYKSFCLCKYPISPARIFIVDIYTLDNNLKSQACKPAYAQEYNWQTIIWKININK